MTQTVVVGRCAAGALVATLAAGCYLSHERAEGDADAGPVVDCPRMPGPAWETEDIATDVTSYAIAGDPTCGLHVVYSESVEGRLWHTVGRAGGSRRSLVALHGVVGSGGLAVDGDVAHVAYVDEGLRYARGEGSAWSTEMIDPWVLSAAIAVDPSGAPHILYSRAESEELRHAARGPGAWGIETVDSRRSFAPVLRIDADGRLHATYSWDTSPPEQSVVYAVREADSSVWSMVSMEIDGLEIRSQSALVLVGYAPHLFYAAAVGAGREGLRHAVADGTPFTFEWIDEVSSRRIEPGAGTADAFGTIHLVYDGSGGARTWAHGPPGAIALESIASVLPPEGNGPLVAVDGAGVVHVVVSVAGRLVHFSRAAP